MMPSCTVVAERDGDKMVLKGFGAKSAKWSDGASIEKSEPVKIPDISIDDFRLDD